mgnify:CR=1 FL=1
MARRPAKKQKTGPGRQRAGAGPGRRHAGALSLWRVSGLIFGVHFHVTQFLAMLAGLLAYIPLHELVHGLCMKYFGAKKVHYGYAGVYAWAGSKAYFGRKSYIVIALAPLVFWGLVLAALCIVAPAQWFWVFYLVQVTNVSGAAGDFYIAWKAARMPAGVLVQDTGLEMTFYAPPPA